MPAALCPDQVVELASPNDDPLALRSRKTAHRAHGTLLGWPLLPDVHAVEIWKGVPAALRLLRWQA